MNIGVTISNIHAKGFAFAITDEGDQVFIPPHVVDGNDIARGQKVDAQVAINPNEAQRSNTKWVAVNLAAQSNTEFSTTEFGDVRKRDEAVHHFICEVSYVTTSEIAAGLGIDQKTAGNSAQRLYNNGYISKADVFNRVGQARPSFILWASTAADFVEQDK